MCARCLLLIEPPADVSYLIFGLELAAELLQVLIPVPARQA